MDRIIFVDQMNDRREIRINDNGDTKIFYNGELTGKFYLHEDEIIDILHEENEAEAFAVIHKIENEE